MVFVLSGLKATSAEAQERATRTATTQVVFPQDSNLLSSDYPSTALSFELEKTSPRMLNFGNLIPATSLFYDVNNDLNVMCDVWGARVLIFNRVCAIGKIKHGRRPLV